MPAVRYVRGVTLDVLDHWTSPRSGVRYPSRWRLAIPGAALSFEISPRLADQELIVGTLAPSTATIPVVGASFANGVALSQPGSQAQVRVDPPQQVTQNPQAATKSPVEDARG